MKIDPKMEENSLNFDPQARLGAVLGTSGRQSGSRCGLDCLWNSIWRPPGSHLGTKIGQDGAMLANLATKMANLAAFWATVWSIWGSRARSFQKLAKVRKRTTLHHFCLVFEGWGGRLELLGELFWAILATSWPILADVGFKLGASWQDVAQRWPR